MRNIRKRILFLICAFQCEEYVTGRGAVSTSDCRPESVILTVILLVFSLGMVSCSKATDNDVLKETLTDSLTLALQAEYELLLNKASDYANEAYYCNVDGEYALALQYIDSAMVCLNEHYGKYARRTASLYDFGRG